MKKILLSLFLVSTISFTHAQFQLRPIMVTVNPVALNIGELNPEYNNLRDAMQNGDLGINFLTIGAGIGVNVRVLKPLWFGFTYSNSMYSRDFEDDTYKFYQVGDTNFNEYSSKEYNVVAANSFSIGLMYMPGNINKFVSPYIKLSFISQLTKFAGYTGFKYVQWYEQTNYTNSSSSSTFEDGQEIKYRNSGLSLGVGLNLRLSQNLRLNLFDIQVASLNSSSTHVFNLFVKTGLTAFIFKQK